MNEQKEIRIKPEQLTNVFCPVKGCECARFDKTYLLKKIPAMISPSGKEFIQPIEIYVCRECGWAIKELMPPGAIVFPKTVTRVQTGN